MCSIGPLHQVYIFQHTFADADIEARPIESDRVSSRVSSDVDLKSKGYDSGRYTAVSDTDRSSRKERTESSADELPRTDRRNRRLAVVNKILDEMDDAIVNNRF